jgi:curved DNA-binding protein CbpA
MENRREIFLQNINEFIAFSKSTADKDIIKSKYLELVKKYHPDINSETDKSILNEYMIIINNTFEKIMNNRIKDIKHKNTENDTHDFSFYTFCQLLAKIVETGITSETIKDKIFTEHKKLLILEIKKESSYAGEAFELLLTKETVAENEQKIDLFNDGIRYYMYILRSVQSSHKEKYKNMPNIKIANRQTEKVADSYLNEYKKYCKKDDQKDAVEIIMEWLKEINTGYRKGQK